MYLASNWEDDALGAPRLCYRAPLFKVNLEHPHFIALSSCVAHVSPRSHDLNSKALVASPNLLKQALKFYHITCHCKHNLQCGLKQYATAISQNNPVLYVSIRASMMNTVMCPCTSVGLFFWPVTPPPFHCWATNQFSLVNLPAFLSSFSSFFSASFHLPLLLKEVLNICVKTHCVLESRAQANLLHSSVLKIGHLITCMKSITKHLDMWFGIFNRELLYDDAYVLLITCDLNNVHTCLHIQHVNKWGTCSAT